METLQMCYSSYKEFKYALDTEMTRTAEGFVRIGYMLEYAAETNIINEGGYETVNDFAKAEYGIDATQVSRFVNIYRRFGVPGEPRLQEKYTSHGVAKLGIMLTLPDAINEELSDAYSKSEITEVKRIVDEENKISDIEVLCEKKGELQQLLPEGFKQLVMQFVKDYPEEYVKIYDAVTMDDVKEVMAPNGESVYKVRVPGVGQHLLFTKANEKIVVTAVRTGEKEIYEWEQFFDALKEYFVLGTDAKDSWSNIFKEPYPEAVKEESQTPAKPDSHNVQQAKPKKESRVKTPKPKKEAPTPVEEPEKEMEEQLPGQMNVTDFPDYLPDSMKEEKPEVLTGEVVDAGEVIEETTDNSADADNDNVQQDSEGMKVEYIAPVQDRDKANIIRGYKAGIKAAMTIMSDKYEDEDWSSVYVKASDIAFRAKKIMELEGKN